MIFSRYGTLKTWAQELGLDDAVRSLDQAPDKKTDAALTKIAEAAVNQEAEAAEIAALVAAPIQSRMTCPRAGAFDLYRLRLRMSGEKGSRERRFSRLPELS